MFDMVFSEFVVFTLLALEELHTADVDVPLMEVATWTILLSVILHGLSVHPLAAVYGNRIRAGDHFASELVELEEPRIRRHFLRGGAGDAEEKHHS
jgi:hypothetical protein